MGADPQAIDIVGGEERFDLEFLLPPPEPGRGGSFGGRSWGHTACGPCHFGRPAGGEARIELAVRLEDGSAARNTGVVIQGHREVPLVDDGRMYLPDGWQLEGRTDDAGFAVFDAVPVGPCVAWVAEPGFVMGDAVRLDLSRGATAHPVIEESPGRTVTVTAVDRHGRPLPGATLLLPWSVRVSVDTDGVQSLDLVTDGAGRVVLPRVGPAVRNGKPVHHGGTAILGARHADFDLAEDEVKVVLDL